MRLNVAAQRRSAERSHVVCGPVGEGGGEGRREGGEEGRLKEVLVKSERYLGGGGG